MYNPATTLIYCCIPGDELAGCWTYESPCSHGQNPRKPGDNQTKCTDQIMTDSEYTGISIADTDTD
jgi:hypothetical protein